MPTEQLQEHTLKILAGSSNETVIAALLQDVGQFLSEDVVLDQVRELKSNDDDESVGRVGHNTIGEQYLKSLGFGCKVRHLVVSHVRAKRYLTGNDQIYYDSLSSASEKNLQFQGGPFLGDKLEEFRADRLSSEMVFLRKWDYSAKIVGIEDSTPRAGEYRVLLEEHLLRERANGHKKDIEGWTC